MFLKTTLKFGYLAFFFFIILFALTLPFPYAFLFDVGGFFSPVIEPVVGFLGIQVLGLPMSCAPHISSDATSMYVLVVLCLVLSVIFSGLYMFLGPPKEMSPFVKYYFKAFISYYLALHLMKYGFDKVFKHQFYFPEPNTLYTPVGYLSKSMLYWSSMGSSYGYVLFLGISEVLVAVLLCFRKTRVLSAMGAVVIMVHVVMVNFGFDISVKLFALFLALLAVVIALPGLKTLYRALVQEKTVSYIVWKPNYNSNRLRLLYALGKSLLVSVLLFESLFPYFQAWAFNGDEAPRPHLYGAYVVTHQVPSKGFKRIFIHSRGYLVTQDLNDVIKDYEILKDDGQKLVLYRKGKPESVLYYKYQVKDSLLALQGKFGGDSIRLQTRKLNIGQLPLHKDGFRWTIDGYVKH